MGHLRATEALDRSGQYHNYPRTLQEYNREGTLWDLAATDILRDRERGVPRYNRFREAFHKAPVRRFDQLSANPAWAEEIRHVYNDEHYTKAGLDWINNSSMKTVLLRHFPELAPALGPIENAFAPWVRVVR